MATALAAAAGTLARRALLEGGAGRRTGSEPLMTAAAEAAPALPASGSSFYTAMRILPREQREAMYAIYAFCRAVDDIADDGGRATCAALRSLARRHRSPVSRAGTPPRRPISPSRRAASGCGARISAPSSTAWKWT